MAIGLLATDGHAIGLAIAPGSQFLFDTSEQTRGRILRAGAGFSGGGSDAYLQRIVP